jgi:exodeoxyribonuclease VII large subunit
LVYRIRMGPLPRAEEWKQEMIPRVDQYAIDNPVWSVSDLNAYIKELIDLDYRLGDLRIIGEISNFTHARSGHLYFTLKDDRAQIRCVMWRTFAERTFSLPEDGDAVLVEGRVSVYEANGQYQLYVERLEPAGRGDLALAFERLKERLAEEGLFDPAIKKQIPAFPNRIGIVTSSEAAALRDIQNVLKRRWPLARVLVAPTPVQGTEAPMELIRALNWLDGRNDIDTIIVTRGGGTIEDLWAFNDEELARAIFHAAHPIIVGVGHESDFTIADFVADLRAPTPSAAAELAVPDLGEIQEQIRELRQDLKNGMRALIIQRRAYLVGLVRTLNNLSPQGKLDSNRQLLDWLAGRLDRAILRHLERKRGLLDIALVGLEAVSPLSTLARGYAIVRKEDGDIVRSIRDVSPGDGLKIHVVDGDFDARVD